MADRITGISDQIKVLDSNSSEVSFGWIQSGSYRIDNKMETRGSVGGGADYQYNIDGVVEVTGTIETYPVSLEILKVFGSYSAGTVTLTDSLPEHTIQMNTSSGKYIEFTGVKFGRFTIEFSKGEEIKVTTDFMAKSAEEKTGSVTYTLPSTSPLNYLDAKMKIGANYVGSVDTGSIEYNRDLESIRGIENVSDGNKRKPTQILEKLKSISFDLTIEITDSTAWQQVMGGSTIQDSRSDTSLTLETANGKITLSGVRVNDLDVDKNADGEVRTAKISGNALGMTITNIS